jgi:hypothetical protein
MRRLFPALAVVALLLATAAQAEPPAKGPDIDAKAAAAIASMCDFLKKQPVLAFTAEVSQEVVYPSGQTIQVNRVLDMVLKRPDKLYARITGDERDRVFVYDGKTAIRADLDKGVYAVLDAPPTVDGLLTLLAEKYGMVAPLSDFLVSDPCAALLNNVQVGDDLGEHLAAGKACEHLAFTQKDVDWQLWIENGKLPLPRKLVINDKEKMGWPQYSASLTQFDLHPKLPAGLFTFKPAKDARQIDFIPPTAKPIEAEKK